MTSERAVEQLRAEGFGLFESYEATGDPRLLADAAERFRRCATMLADDDPRKPVNLRHVSHLMRRLHDDTSEMWAIDESISAAGVALRLERDPEGVHDARVLLGMALYIRFESAKDRRALARAISVLREAGQEARFWLPETLSALHHLGVALNLAYQDSDDDAYLSEAVQALRPAAQNPHPLRVQSLHLLVRLLPSLSSARSDPGLLQEAEAAARWAVTITEGASGEQHSTALFMLARTLESVWHSTRRISALEEAVQTGGTAVHLTRDPVEQRLRNTYINHMFVSLRAARNRPESE